LTVFLRYLYCVFQCDTGEILNFDFLSRADSSERWWEIYFSIILELQFRLGAIAMCIEMHHVRRIMVEIATQDVIISFVLCRFELDCENKERFAFNNSRIWIHFEGSWWIREESKVCRSIRLSKIVKILILTSER